MSSKPFIFGQHLQSAVEFCVHVGIFSADTLLASLTVLRSTVSDRVPAALQQGSRPFRSNPRPTDRKI